MNLENFKTHLNASRFLHLLYDAYRIPRFFLYDTLRFLRYYMYSRQNMHSLLASIMSETHALERGMTMMEMKRGFGEKKLLILIDSIHLFADKYNDDNFEILHACSVILEYQQLHKKLDYSLTKILSEAISNLLARFPVQGAKQIEMTEERYWQYVKSPFNEFSCSRHSVRSFEGSISILQIKKSINIANNAPSACNRQYVRVHCVSDKMLISKCFSLQRGNRGFGHLVDKLIIITADIRYANQYERNDIFTNAGIYCMNLSYALHFNKVAHCILNWSVPPARDRKLREFLNIPIEEEITVFVACGGLPKSFKVASSPKKNWKSILTIH